MEAQPCADGGLVSEERIVTPSSGRFDAMQEGWRQPPVLLEIERANPRAWHISCIDPWGYRARLGISRTTCTQFIRNKSRSVERLAPDSEVERLALVGKIHFHQWLLAQIEAAEATEQE